MLAYLRALLTPALAYSTIPLAIPDGEVWQVSWTSWDERDCLATFATREDAIRFVGALFLESC